jgi:hypothetical protein
MAPVLVGAGEAPSQPSPGEGAPGAPLADGEPTLLLRVDGVVRIAATGDVAGAGVIVRSFVGESMRAVGETVTRADGSFSVADPLVAAVSHRSCGVVAVSPDGALMSHPAFVEAVTAGASAQVVRLWLRPAAGLTATLLSPHGAPVPHGECFVRWLLPRGVTLESHEMGAASPRHSVLRADEQGRVKITLPPGRVLLQGRRTPESGLGAPTHVALGAGDRPIVSVTVGEQDARVIVEVVDPEGTPIPGPILALERELILHVVASQSDQDLDDGCLRGAEDGRIRIAGISVGSDPFVVAIGAAGYVPTRFEVRADTVWEAPAVVELRPRYAREVYVQSAGLSPRGVDIRWNARASPGSSPTEGSDPAMDLLEEVLPPIESTSLDGGAGCRFAVVEPGTYVVRARLAGGTTVSEVVVIDESAGEPVILPLPEGRVLTLRHVPPPSDVVPAHYAWRLGVSGSAPSTSGDAGDEARMDVHGWRPTDGSRELRVWCQRGVESLVVRGATSIDLPVRPSTYDVPPAEDPLVEIETTSHDHGTLLATCTSADGTPQGSLELEVVQLLQGRGRNERRRIWTGADGLASLPLPPGSYSVRWSTRYGRSPWQRFTIGAGATQEVHLRD